MIIDTKYLGRVDIDDKSIIEFSEGILGFEHLKRFVIINILGTPLFKCLQSVDEKGTAFIVINPWDIFKDYEINVDDKELLSIGSSDSKNLMVYSLLTITPQKITANLLGPVIINYSSQKGKQVVLYKSSYTTRHEIKNPAEMK